MPRGISRILWMSSQTWADAVALLSAWAEPD